ncbi:hypothetical protein KEM54_000924 [Ascosphaera aggregata]|nr:hypothetical protein KEM54_000924 [Ascosphaera aggregata]
MSDKKSVAVIAPNDAIFPQQTTNYDSTEDESRPSTPEEYPGLPPQHHRNSLNHCSQRSVDERMVDEKLRIAGASSLSSIDLTASLLPESIDLRRSFTISRSQPDVNEGTGAESTMAQEGGAASWHHDTRTRRTHQTIVDTPKSDMSIADAQTPWPLMRSRTISSKRLELAPPSLARSTTSFKNLNLNRSKSVSAAKEAKAAHIHTSRTYVVSLPQKTPSVTSTCLQKTLMTQRAARARLQACDMPKIPSRFREKNLSHSSSQSSLLPSPKLATFKTTGSRRRSLTASAIQAPKVPKTATTGIREMDRHVSILSKENFDLKLRLHHKSQQLGALQSELRRLSCVENEVLNLKQAEKEAKRQVSLLRSELLELQEEHARSNESNNLLIDMLRRRDDGLKEAAAIICELEDTIQELQYQLPLGKQRSHVRTDSYASDIWRDLTNETEAVLLDARRLGRTKASSCAPSSKDVSIPERTSSLHATDASRVQTLQEDRMTSRIPHSDQRTSQAKDARSQKHHNRVNFTGDLREGECKSGDGHYNRQGVRNSSSVKPTRGELAINPKHDLRLQLNKLTSSLNEAEKLFAEVGKCSPDRRALFDAFVAPLGELVAAANSPTQISVTTDYTNEESSLRPSTAPPCSDHAISASSNSKSIESQSRADCRRYPMALWNLSNKSEPADVNKDIRSSQGAQAAPALNPSRSSSASLLPITANCDGIGGYVRWHGLYSTHIKRPHSSGDVMIGKCGFSDQMAMAEERSDFHKTSRGDLLQRVPHLSNGNNSASSRNPITATKANQILKISGTVGDPTTRPDSRTRTDLLRNLTKRAKERQNRFLEHSNVEKDTSKSEEQVKTLVGGEDNPSNSWTEFNVPSSASLQRPATKVLTQSCRPGIAGVPLAPPSLSTRKRPALSIDTTHCSTASLRSFGYTANAVLNEPVAMLDTFESAPRQAKVVDKDDNKQRENGSKSVPTSTFRTCSASTSLLIVNNTALVSPESDELDRVLVPAMDANSILGSEKVSIADGTGSDFGNSDKPTSRASTTDDQESDSSVGRAVTSESNEGAVLKEASNEYINLSIDSPIEGPKSSVTRNANRQVPKPSEQGTQGHIHQSTLAKLITDEKRSFRPLHSRTVSEVNTTSMSSNTHTGRTPSATSPTIRPVSDDRGSMDICEPPTAPAVVQDEWPGSRFQNGFSVDLKSAIEFQQWQERERQAKSEQPSPTALLPYLDGLRVQVPSSPFVPVTAGSTVTVVTGGADNNNSTSKSHQGFRKRMLQPFGRKAHENDHVQRPPASPPACSKPLTPTNPSTTDGLNSNRLQGTKLRQSGTRLDAISGKLGKKPSSKNLVAGDLGESGDNNGVLSSGSEPYEMSPQYDDLAVTSPSTHTKRNTLGKNISPGLTTKMAENGSPAQCKLKSPSCQNQPSHRAGKSMASDNDSHKQRLSSAIFGWMKPSGRRQEGRSNIKSLNCTRDQHPSVQNIDSLQGGRRSPVTSPVCKSASEFETTRTPNTQATSCLPPTDSSVAKTPFMKTNGRSYLRPSRDSVRKSSNSPNSLHRPDLSSNPATTSTASSGAPRSRENGSSPLEDGNTSTQSMIGETQGC